MDADAPSLHRSARFPLGAEVTVDRLEREPWSTVAALQRHEPVSWVPALGAWFVTGRELVIEAMRDPDRFTVDDDRFTTAAVLGNSMLSLDGSEHRRHRSPFAPSFRPGILREEFDGFLASEVADLLAGLDPNGAELRTGLAGPLAVNTITRFLGLADVAADDVLGWYRSISKAVTDLTTGAGVDEADLAVVAEIDLRVQRTLDGPAPGTGSAAGSLLGRVAAGRALRAEEIGSSAAVIMFGAIETSEGMIANLLWHLLTNDGAWSALRRDRELVADAIEESLRLEPAAAVVDRYTTREASLGGVTIPDGELVTLSLLAANHDPQVFDRPQQFRPGRANARQHVTFAQGPHACLGLHLARMETAAALCGLLDTAPGLRLLADRSKGPSGLIFRKPAALWAAWG